MRFFKYFLAVLACGFCFGGLSAVAQDDKVYVVEEEGRTTLRSLFDRREKTSAGQWEYASETRKKGWLRKADRRMLYLVRRWPNSKEAPWAARARADMLYSRGKLEEAFAAYQYLIDNYSSRMGDYDSVLENQFDVAVKMMNRRRMRWFFGGYRAPEYAVDYFETVIRNGPQWPKAPEVQFMVGRCYQESDELELAISSYGVLGYRYPDSSFSEDAAWRQINCLDALRRKYPNNQETLDRTLTATTVFLTQYPGSAHKGEIIQLRNTLYEIKAEQSFSEAVFYAKVPRQPQAAILYYESMMEEYPKSKLVSDARKRIEELEELMAMPEQESGALPVRSRPLFGKEAGDDEE